MIQRKVAPEMLQPAIKGLLLRKTNQVKLFVLWREIPECGNTPGFARQMLRFLDKINLTVGFDIGDMPNHLQALTNTT